MWQFRDVTKEEADVLLKDSRPVEEPDLLRIYGDGDGLFRLADGQILMLVDPIYRGRLSHLPYAQLFEDTDGFRSYLDNDLAVEVEYDFGPDFPDSVEQRIQRLGQRLGVSIEPGSYRDYVRAMETIARTDEVGLRGCGRPGLYEDVMAMFGAYVRASWDVPAAPAKLIVVHHEQDGDTFYVPAIAPYAEGGSPIELRELFDEWVGAGEIPSVEE